MKGYERNTKLFNGIDEPSYFKNVKNKNKEEIKSNYSGSIIYLHYPNYTNHTKNTFSGVFLDEQLYLIKTTMNLNNDENR